MRCWWAGLFGFGGWWTIIRTALHRLAMVAKFMVDKWLDLVPQWRQRSKAGCMSCVWMIIISVCMKWSNPETDFVTVSLFRSLIFCHSTTSDDCSDESHAGSVSDDFRAWIPGWKAGVTSGNQTFLRTADNERWSNAQPSTGQNTHNLVHQTTSLRENKRSLRRSFSVKVGLDHFNPISLICYLVDTDHRPIFIETAACDFCWCACGHGWKDNIQ